MRVWPAVFVVVIFASLVRAQERIDIEKEFESLCSFDILFSEGEGGPNFSIQVSFHDAVVTGARISLDHEGKVVATARTNSDGLAHFSSIPPGEYHPTAADGLVFPGTSYVIKVRPNRGPGEIVKVEWPIQSVSVRALTGRLTTSKEPDDPADPLSNTKVEVLDLRTGQLLELVRTNSDGLYNFSETKAGLYAFQVTPTPSSEKGKPQSHAIAVELDISAEQGTIPELKVVQSECWGTQFFRKLSSGDWEQY